jgi:hypothetical protein
MIAGMFYYEHHFCQLWSADWCQGREKKMVKERGSEQSEQADPAVTDQGQGAESDERFHRTTQ